MGALRAGGELARALRADRKRLDWRFNDAAGADFVYADRAHALVVPTETVAIAGRTAKELRTGSKWLRDMYGMEEIQEGRQGKLLLRAPEGGAKGVRMVIEAARLGFEEGRMAICQPNFLRVLPKTAAGKGGSKANWGIDNKGNPGVVGADVNGLAAWTITEGNPEVRIAVLDEGVDTRHPWLRDAVVAEKDFVEDGRLDARPDGDDAHGRRVPASCAAAMR